MRTPLNAIIGPAQLLMQSPDGKLDRTLVEMIHNAGKHQLAMVNDILEFASTGNFGPKVRCEPLNLCELLEALVREFSVRATDKNIVVRYECDSHLPKVLEGDPKLLRQVVTNLLSNAFKYLNAGDVIEVRVECEGTVRDAVCQVWIKVRDTGIGVSKEAQEKIFEPFFQLEEALTRTHEGVGLGLAICRQIAMRLDGEIGLESELGKGSIFWIRIPMSVSKVAWFEGRGRATKPMITDLKGKRILLVDDDTDNRL